MGEFGERSGRSMAAAASAPAISFGAFRLNAGPVNCGATAKK